MSGGRSSRQEQGRRVRAPAPAPAPADCSFRLFLLRRERGDLEWVFFEFASIENPRTLHISFLSRFILITFKINQLPATRARLFHPLFLQLRNTAHHVTKPLAH